MDFSVGTSLSVTFDELFAFISQIFRVFCLDLVKHSSMKIQNSKDVLKIATKNSSRAATHSLSWTVKSRYELIDFPCSPHSSDFVDFLSVWSFSFSHSDNLHENFRLANRCTTRTPTVIRLTVLFANNSRLKLTEIYFQKCEQFCCHCQLPLVIWYFRRAEKCVHSPSIHHAISRQKLSINQSTRQSNDEKGTQNKHRRETSVEFTPTQPSLLSPSVAHNKST